MQLGSVLLAMTVLGASCAHDAQYIPKTRDEVRLTVRGGRLHLVKNGLVWPMHPSTPGEEGVAKRGATTFHCDAEAREMQERAQAAFLAGQAADERGRVANMFSWGIGMAFWFTARAEEERGIAASIDAMNRHNDVAACGGPKRPPELMPAPTSPTELPAPPVPLESTPTDATAS